MINRPLALLVITAASLLAAAPAHAQTPQPRAQLRVLVIPFTALNVPDSQQWITKAVAENIVADFGRTPGFLPLAFHGQILVEDNATAARLARQASASLVIRGAAQVVGTSVRLTAQLIDAKTGDTLTTASVTGPADDLLKMEDDLSAQLRGVSTQTAATPGAPTAPLAGAQPVYVQPAQPAAPQIILISQPAAPTYPPYPAYNTPYYGSNFGYGYYPGLITTVSYGNNGYCPPNYCPPVYCPPTSIGNLHLVRSTGPTGGPLTITSPPGGLLPIPNLNVIGTPSVQGQIQFNQPVVQQQRRPSGGGPSGNVSPRGGGRTSYISQRGR